MPCELPAYRSPTILSRQLPAGSYGQTIKHLTAHSSLSDSCTQIVAPDSQVLTRKRLPGHNCRFIDKILTSPN
jgi:hypothetical protein